MFQVLFQDSRSWAISFPPARISTFGKRLLVDQKSSCRVPFLPAARPDSSEDSSLSFAFLSIRFPFSLSETVPPCSKKCECDLTHGACRFHQREFPPPKVLPAYLSKVFHSGSFRSQEIFPRIVRISRAILTFTPVKSELFSAAPTCEGDSRSWAVLFLRARTSPANCVFQLSLFFFSHDHEVDLIIREHRFENFLLPGITDQMDMSAAISQNVFCFLEVTRHKFP